MSTPGLPTLLWGTVVEHDRGWRSSHAYPERLYLVCSTAGRHPGARFECDLAHYGVPVTRIDASSPAEAMAYLEALAA